MIRESEGKLQTYLVLLNSTLLQYCKLLKQNVKEMTASKSIKRVEKQFKTKARF